MHTLKLTQIGNSAGVILPHEMLAKLGVTKGDAIYAVDRHPGVRLTVADPGFAEQKEVARRVMKDRRAVLRKLAK